MTSDIDQLAIVLNTDRTKAQLFCAGVQLDLGHKVNEAEIADAIKACRKRRSRGGITTKAVARYLSKHQSSAISAQDQKGLARPSADAMSSSVRENPAKHKGRKKQQSPATRSEILASETRKNGGSRCKQDYRESLHQIKEQLDADKSKTSVSSRLKSESPPKPEEAPPDSRYVRSETRDAENVPIFLRQSLNRPDDIVSIWDYHPYWISKSRGIKNPHFDDDLWSSRILDLKRGNLQAVRRFYGEIDPLLNTGFPITIVPSHDPSNTMSGIRKLAHKLAQNGRVDATSCLQRYRSIPKLSSGGSRRRSVHLQSIKVINAVLIKGKNVLLMDDVVTSGNSLRACASLLRDAGAAGVQCFALTRTVR